MGGAVGHNRAKALTATGEWEEWVGTKTLAFCSVINLHFFEIYKRDLVCAWSIAFLHICHPLWSILWPGSPLKKGLIFYSTTFS